MKEFEEYIGCAVDRKIIKSTDTDSYDDRFSYLLCQRFYGKENEIEYAINKAKELIRQKISHRKTAFLYAIIGNLLYIKGDFKSAMGYFMVTLSMMRDDNTPWYEFIFCLRSMDELQLFEDVVYNLQTYKKRWANDPAQRMTQQKFMELHDEINPTQRKLGILQATKYCNQNCVFCATRIINEQPSFSEIKKRIKEIRKSGANELMISGGEPTIRTDLLEIIRYAKAMGFNDISIQTNAVLLNNIDVMIDSGLGWVQASVHTHDEKTYDNITRTKGLFKKMLAGVAKASQKTKLCILITICSKNFKTLKKTLQFYHEKFPQVHTYSLNYCQHEGNATENSWIVPKLSEVEPYLNEAMQYLEDNNKAFFVDFVPLCFMKGFEKHATSEEFAKKRDSESIYFYQENDDINYEKKYAALMTNKCSVCLHRKTCPGIDKYYAKLHGTKELKPIWDYQKLTKVLMPKTVLHQLSELGIKTKNTGRKVKPEELSVSSFLDIQKVMNGTKTLTRIQSQKINSNILLGLHSYGNENLYIAQHEMLPRFGKFLEEQNTEKSISLLGVLLGYPECCIKEYVKTKKIVCDIPSIYAKTSKHCYLLNNIYLESGFKPVSLIPHIPCTYDCKKSMILAKESLHILKNRIQKDELKKIKDRLLTTVYYKNLDDFFLVKNNRIILSNSKTHPIGLLGTFENYTKLVFEKCQDTT